MERKVTYGADDIGGEETNTAAVRAEENGRPDAVSSSLVRPRWDFTKQFVMALWSEARDRTSPDWPPPWMRVIFAIVFGAFLAVTIVNLAAAILVRIGVGLFDGARASDLVQVTINNLAEVTIRPVRGFLDSNASALPFSGDQLFTLWTIAGALLLLSSAYSWRGYLGWLVFGAMSAGMVWTASPSVSQWTATGVTATTWSILSVIGRAGGSHREEPRRPRPSRLRRRSAELRGAAIQRRADVQARTLGHRDLAGYFASNEKRSIKAIAEDLRLTRSRARDLRRHYLPDSVTPRAMNQRRRAEIAQEYLAGGCTAAEVARRHGISESSVRRYKKEYEALTHPRIDPSGQATDH